MNQTVVAHNGLVFDFPILEKTIECYGMKSLTYYKCYTYGIFKYNLASLCKNYSIPINHYDALSDEIACVKLLQLYLQKQ